LEKISSSLMVVIFLLPFRVTRGRRRHFFPGTFFFSSPPEEDVSPPPAHGLPPAVLVSAQTFFFFFPHAVACLPKGSFPIFFHPPRGPELPPLCEVSRSFPPRRIPSRWRKASLLFSHVLPILVVFTNFLYVCRFFFPPLLSASFLFMWSGGFHELPLFFFSR